MIPDLSSEGMRHVVRLLVLALGDPHHQCPRCKNAFAATCRVAHTWFYTTFDEVADSNEDPFGRPARVATINPPPDRADAAAHRRGALDGL